MVADRTLILLRHGKSDWSGDEADVRRPLAKRGRRQAPDAGRWLAAHVDSIDVAVVSRATRAVSTWDLAAAELAEPPDTRLDERVYAAGAGDLLDVVRGFPDAARTVVMVGHNPGLEDLVLLLTGTPTPMPTSALAVLTLPGPWADADRGTATLVTAGRPPEG